jgi:hypothetical protein
MASSTSTTNNNNDDNISSSSYQRRQNNSTSTVYVSETMTHPDSDGILVSIAKIIRGHIRSGEIKMLKKKNKKKMDITKDSENNDINVIVIEKGILTSKHRNGDVSKVNEVLISQMQKMNIENVNGNNDGGDGDDDDDDKENNDVDDEFDDTLSQDGGVELPLEKNENNNKNPSMNPKDVEKAAKTFLKLGAFLDKISPFRPSSIKANMPSTGTALSQKLHLRPLPSTREIFRFMKNIYITAQCSVDCVIISLIYVERFTAMSNRQLSCTNWKSIITTAMLLASKVWDDLSMVNQDFSTFLHYPLSQINVWEFQFLQGIKYNVRVSASEYADFYFEARISTAQRRFERVKRLKNVKQTEILFHAISIGDRKKVEKILKQINKSKENKGRDNNTEFILPDISPMNMEQANKLEIVSSAMEKRLIDMKTSSNSSSSITITTIKLGKKQGGRSSDQFFVRKSSNLSRLIVD